MSTSNRDQLIAIANDYVAEGNPFPATAREIAAWAIATDRWTPPRESLITHCADQLADAMREEHIQDPQGRMIRAKHAVRITSGPRQGSFWTDIRMATRQHMAIAFQQRRQQIVGDCRQLKSDVDSYNENFNMGAAIQLVLDFTLDVEEAELVGSTSRR